MDEHLPPGSEEVAMNLAHADTAQGLQAGTEAHGGGHAVVPSALGLNPTAWVALAMTVFIVILIVKRVPGLLVGGLDKKIAAIREQLDEAKTLRAEAEALRAEYEAKIKAAETEAATMREHAEAEAKQILTDAKVVAKDLTVRRAKMAEDKIAAAERTAIAEIRAKAVDAATTAAAALIADGHGVAQDKTLIDRTIAGLGRTH